MTYVTKNKADIDECLATIYNSRQVWTTLDNFGQFIYWNIYVKEIMGDTTFDVKLHLGQGVTKLPGDCKG